MSSLVSTQSLLQGFALQIPWSMPRREKGWGQGGSREKLSRKGYGESWTPAGTLLLTALGEQSVLHHCFTLHHAMELAISGPKVRFVFSSNHAPNKGSSLDKSEQAVTQHLPLCSICSFSLEHFPFLPPLQLFLQVQL